MSRAGAAVAALALVAAACTGSGSDTTSTSTEPTLESETTAPESDTTDPSPGGSSDRDLTEGDPLDSLSGYTVEALGDGQSDIGNRLDGLPEELFDSDLRSLVRSDDGEIVVAVFEPAGNGRGDPALADAVAAGIAGNVFADPEFIDIDGMSARRIFVDDEPWYFWASNTRLYVLAGDDDVAEDVLAELMDLAEGEYLWQQGDCLGFADDADLPFAPFGALELVECESAHSHEVTHSDTLDEGPDDPYPGTELEERADLICGEAFADYVGEVPRLTTLRPVIYRPDASEWAEGDRYVACVVGAPGGEEFVGTVEGAATDYARIVEVGDCISDDGIVSCDEVHWGEIIAIPTHPGDADDDYPGDDPVNELIDGECRDTLSDLDVTTGDVPINVQARGLDAFDWGAGSRQYECLAFVTQDGLAPIDVIGSFTGDWRTVDEGIVV